MALLADVKDIFGTINPPPALQKFIGTDKTGTAGIGKFLSNLIALFYSVAAIVLIFMLIWGAFEWLTSGGDKEKLDSARRRIISAIIGIILFAVTFAVIGVLGTFTGFKFFTGQEGGRTLDPNSTFRFQCPDGTYTTGAPGDTLVMACKGRGY